MIDYKNEAVIAGFIFGISATFGTDVYKKSKRMFHKLEKRYKKVKKIDIPEIKKSVAETMDYVDYYLSGENR